MAHSEIDSFVTKFKCLLNSGYDVTFTVDAIAVQAWVTLQVGLGHPPIPPYHRYQGQPLISNTIAMSQQVNINFIHFFLSFVINW